MGCLEVLKNSFKSVCAFRSNRHLEVLVFKENTKVTGEKTSQSKGENQQQTQPTNQDLNPAHIGARRELSPMHHPCSPQKRERKWLKASGFDVNVHLLKNCANMCNIVWNPCGNTTQEQTFFCFVEFAYKGQLANGITFCRMDQLLGDPLCWELCYLIKKFIFSEISLKKASFSPNNIIFKKKKTEILRIKLYMYN